MGAFSKLVTSACLLSVSKGGTMWKAPKDDSVLNANSGGDAEKNYTVRLNVARMDYWGPVNPHMDIDFKDESDEKEVQVYFPGTDGNSKSMPHWLVHGKKVRVLGRREAGATETNTLKGQLLASTAADNTVTTKSGKADKRPVFVAREVEILDDEDDNDSGRRLEAGNAPANQDAFVILVNPCGEELQEATVAKAEASFFGSGPDSYKSMVNECSRGAASTSGKVTSVSVCPASKDIWAVLKEVKKLLKNNTDFAASTYRVHIVPDDWLSARGVATVGGGTSWVRDSVFASAGVHLHEIGHNLRLHHANILEGQEYGDESSALGWCCSDRCYHFLHSYQLGWADWMTNTPSLAALENATSTELVIPELALKKESGIKLQTSSKGTISLSYRGSSGFDRHLLSTLNNQVYAHLWSGTRRKHASMTYLIASARVGQTLGLIHTGLKLTFHSVSSSNEAKVTVCKKTNAEWLVTNPKDLSACGSEAAPAPAPSPPPPTVWTNYVSYKQQNTDKTSYAMIGVGCRSDSCGEVKTAHDTSIRVAANVSAWESLSTGVGTLQCPIDHVVSQIRCLGDGCAEHTVVCTKVLNGKLEPSIQSRPAWFPVEIGSEESSLCPNGKLLVGINCGSSKCAQKQLICHQFVRSETCVPSCNSLGLRCGDDGCGGSCGTCAVNQPGKASETCFANSGRCMAKDLVSDWADEDKGMPQSSLAATGMGCKDSYCGQVRLDFIGVRLADATRELSPIVSDNVGKRFVWSNEAAEAFSSDCKPGKAVTRVLCSGKHCDNLRLECAKVLDWTLDTSGQPSLTNWFSQEGTGHQACPANHVIVGLECQKNQGIQSLLPGFLGGSGHYCEYKRLRCRHIYPQRLGTTNRGVLGAQEVMKVVAASNVKLASAEEREASAQSGTQARMISAATRSQLLLGLALGLAGILAF